MTIKQYAEQKKISPQAVYQRLKKNKLKVDTVTEKETGEITGEGMVILDKLFTSENRQIKPAKDELIEALNNQISTLRQENARLIERLENAEKELSTIKEDRDYLRLQLDKAHDNFTETIKRLPAPGETVTAENRQRLSWRERITGRISSSSKG